MERIKEFEDILKQSKKEVEECQLALSLSSCLKCDQVLECKKRRTYVKDAFVFLNGGEQGGGFNF